MFERMTDQSRRIVIMAQELARKHKHNWIGAEHLVLALTITPDTVAYKILQQYVGEDSVQKRFMRHVGDGSSVSTGHIPFTPKLKRVLEQSGVVATRLGHNWIGTEHLLIALTEFEEPMKILDWDGNDLRTAAINFFGDDAYEREPSAFEKKPVGEVPKVESAPSKIKHMDISEFRKLGFLQEANRLFFHPLGLALEIFVDDDGTERLSGVWDYRDDPEGIYFADGIDREKVRNVDVERSKHRGARVEMFGSEVQSVDS